MKDVRQLKLKVHQLLANELFASLATLNENQQIHSTLVAFSTTDDIAKVYISTGRNTRKFNCLQQFPTVSLLIHNCKNSYEDLTSAIAVSIHGSARELQNSEFEEAKALHLKKHPQMASFLNSPNTAIFEIAVKNYNLVTNFQDVTIIEIKENGSRDK